MWIHQQPSVVELTVVIAVVDPAVVWLNGWHIHYVVSVGCHTVN